MMLSKNVDYPSNSRDDTQFCKPESLLLDGFRLWSQSPQNMAYIRRRLAAEMNEGSAERAAKAMKLLAHVIGVHARRTFYLMHPGSTGATADERALLAMIGAVLHGRRGHANAIAQWLLPTDCHGTVLAVAGELGRALKAGGLEISAPRLAARPHPQSIAIRRVA